jgi:hypothetical protein
VPLHLDELPEMMMSLSNYFSGSKASTTIEEFRKGHIPNVAQINGASGLLLMALVGSVEW